MKVSESNIPMVLFFGWSAPSEVGFGWSLELLPVSSGRSLNLLPREIPVGLLGRWKSYGSESLLGKTNGGILPGLFSLCCLEPDLSSTVPEAEPSTTCCSDTNDASGEVLRVVGRSILVCRWGSTMAFLGRGVTCSRGREPRARF